MGDFQEKIGRDEIASPIFLIAVMIDSENLNQKISWFYWLHQQAENLPLVGVRGHVESVVEFQ